MFDRAHSSVPDSDLLVKMQRSSRLQKLLLPSLTGLLAIIIYGITMAPDLTWAHNSSDGGELITAAVTAGIAHPPGYPTYIVLGKIASLLPLGTIAWRFNLLSAVSTATAVAFVTATALSTLSGTKYQEIVSVATGLTVAFTTLVWSQALIAEVYALNLALVSIFLWSLLTNRSPKLSGLFLGLAITTHLSSLLMVPLALLLTPRRQWLDLFICTAIGLIPFLLLPILANSGSPVIWGNPTTISGWWWLITGQLYYANLGLPETGANLAKTAYLGNILLRQLAWAGWLFVVLGMTTRFVDRRVTISLSATALLYLIYGYLYQTDDVKVNLLPTIILLSPLLAAGLTRIGSWSILVPIGLFLFNYQLVNLHNDRSVRPLADNILSSAPDNAIMLTAGDQSIFTLWYFHHVEQIRDDLYLVDANLFAFDWYRQRLSKLYPDLVMLEKDDLAEFRAGNGRLRPVCEVPPDLGGVAICTPGSQGQQGHDSGG